MAKRIQWKKINESWFCKVFCSLSIIIFSLLLYYCLGERGTNSEDVLDEFIYMQKDSILLNILLMAIFLEILYIYGKLEKFFLEEKRRNILAAAVCIIAVIFGIYWVNTTCTYPQGDQEYILMHARSFNSGDFSALGDGGYLSIYPQQLGMVTLLRILRVFFGDRDYVAFQYLTAVMLPLIIFPGTKIVRYISRNNVKAELFYLLFVFTCFPMYAYTPFVYGDLISVEIGMTAVWGLLSCMEHFQRWKLIWLGASMGLMIILRENMLILAIAMSIVVMIRLIYDSAGRPHLLGMGIAMVLGILIFQGVIEYTYHNVRDREADAIPASAFIVMGANDDYEHPGWSNWYNINLFFECDRDAEKTTRRAMADLKSYINLYKNNPSYMVDFFTRKMVTQWNAPMYQCIVMNCGVIGEQGKIAHNIYAQGILYKWISNYMKVFQLVLYASILFLLIAKRGEWASIERYVLLIAVIGGFFFSLIWEAKTRYIFPYLLMQLPYMAIGVNEIMRHMEAHIYKIKHIA